MVGFGGLGYFLAKLLDFRTFIGAHLSRGVPSSRRRRSNVRRCLVLGVE